MRLTFWDVVVPDHLRFDHARRGGRSLRRLAADVHDGEVRVMAGLEPFNDDGRLLLHASISVGKPGQIGAFRRPTDEEMEAVKAFLPKVRFEEDNEVVESQLSRHLWEICAESR